LACSVPPFVSEQLCSDLNFAANDPNSSHDFGKDIIPYIVKNGRAAVVRVMKSKGMEPW
jgi:ADP-glucose pyrophosphorylase